MPLFSVIVPVYNAQKYVEKTIQSILSQVYQNFELIIIDDGSVDESAKICKKYADKDRRIQYIRQTNKGICASRNYGIRVAQGEYIVFSDDDDYMSPFCLQRLSEKIGKDSELDVIKSSYEQWWLNSKGNVTRKQKHLIEKECVCTNVLEISEFFVLRETGIFNVIWNGAYKKSFLMKNLIYFDEQIKFGGEDNLFNLKLVESRAKALYIQDVLYRHYVIQNHSTSLKFSTNRIDSVLLVGKKEIELYELLYRKQTSKKDFKYIKNRIVASHLMVIFNFINHIDSGLTNSRKSEILKSIYLNDCFRFEGVYPAYIKDIQRMKMKAVALWLYQTKMFSVLNLFCYIANKVRAE